MKRYKAKLPQSSGLDSRPMLRGVLEQLSEMGDPVPRYTAPRCLLVRQAVGGCEACTSSCPHQAVLLSGGGLRVEIDPALCSGCGLCVQACPTGALEYDLLAPLEVLNDQKKNQQGAATLACSQCEAAGETSSQIRCLGRVTPALLSAAGAWNLPLTLLHGDCQTCAVGSGVMGSGDVPERLQRVIQETGELRQATGQPAHVTVRQATAQDAAQSEPKMTRRGAFGALFRSGRKQVARQLPARPLPFMDTLVDWSEPAERTPQEWKWRKETLRPAPGAEQPVVWPAPVVDSTCIDCPVCANVCPTEAITRDLTPEGGVRLLLKLSACTGCMGCVRSCPPQAMHPQREWQPAALEALVLLRESDSVM